MNTKQLATLCRLLDLAAEEELIDGNEFDRVYDAAWNAGKRLVGVNAFENMIDDLELEGEDE